MDVPWLLGVLLLLLGSPPVHAEPLYLLVTPRVIRVGSPTVIHLQAESDSREPLTRPLEVNFTMWDYPLKKTVLGSGQFLLVPGNNYMDQKAVMIPDNLVYPPKPGQQYVIIEVTQPRPTVLPSMEKLILVAPHVGYIYIQTDKPIYTPDHMVHYRVFTVNHKMDPVIHPFTLDIKNPEGIAVLSKDLLAQGGLFVSSFHLPELISLGTWSIEASYQVAPKQKFKASFEVKEYVLPSFEVELKPNKTFFSFSDEALGVDIKACEQSPLHPLVVLRFEPRASCMIKCITCQVNSLPAAKVLLSLALQEASSQTSDFKGHLVTTHGGVQTGL